VGDYAIEFVSDGVKSDETRPIKAAKSKPGASSSRKLRCERLQVKPAKYEATFVNVPKVVEVLAVAEWPDKLPEVQIILKVQLNPFACFGHTR
jgi:hypothetical protein